MQRSALIVLFTWAVLVATHWSAFAVHDKIPPEPKVDYDRLQREERAPVRANQWTLFVQILSSAAGSAVNAQTFNSEEECEVAAREVKRKASKDRQVLMIKTECR